MGLKPVVFALLLTTSLFAHSVPLAPTQPPQLEPNEPPHVDAGLDQTVELGSTVLLDAGDSRDPDGTITEFDWQIISPNGTTFTPECPSCERTRFSTVETGTYTVRLNATDDDDATGTDTLYVTVEPDDGPTVSLSGPTQTTPGELETFVATIDPGTEPVTDISWRIDGTKISGANDTKLERSFSTLGTTNVSVTVTDAIGRTSTDSHEFVVSNNTSSDPGSPIVTPSPGDPGGGNGTPIAPPNGSGTLADRFDPTISGPQLILGDEPLDASYSLSNGPGPSKVSAVDWVVNDGSSTNAATVDVTWTPGDHTLHAIVTYVDGSTDTARFPDGTKDVIADPAPQPTLVEPDVEETALTGRFDVTDEYGNIESITVTVDGTPIFDQHYPEHTYPNRDHINSQYETQLDDPAANHTLTITATDARGQTRTASRTVTKQDAIEILEAGFVNSPVDTYHPRIRSERYTAKHVIRIDLNGNAPSAIKITQLRRTAGILNMSNIRREYDSTQDQLTFRSFWAGTSVRSYNITSLIKVGSSSEEQSIDSTFEVTPSPPELRLTSPTEGTKKRVANWGMVVDASRSFDPDGTDLEIEWTGGARPIQSGEFVGKLDPFDRAGVRITDGYGLSAEYPGSFLSYYVPGIREVVDTSEGPYNESEIVEIEVRTDAYAFTKNSNVYNITLGARSNSSAVNIKSMRKEKVPLSDVQQYSAVQDRLYRWVATVQVPAKSLNESENWVTLYNDDNPERVYVSQELGEVELAFERRKEDVQVSEISYAVENESGVKSTTVQDRKMVRYLLEEGWRIDDIDEIIDSVEIQQETEETVQDTRTHYFESQRRAQKLASAHSEWHYQGTETYARTEEGTETRWVRDRTIGRPTHESRRVLLNPDATRTERQYEYSTTREVETWKIQTIEETVEVTKFRTERKRVCISPNNCYFTVERVPYTTTKTVERTVRKRVTKSVDTTHQYWAQRPHRPSHRSTGATRSVRTEPKEYGREYLVIVPYERTVEETSHVVTETITDTRITWEHMTTVDDVEDARRYTRQSDKRIGKINRHTEWTLRKNTTVTEVVRKYDNKSDVMTTYATVEGTLVYGPDPDDTRPFTLHIELSGYATKEEIINATMQRELQCEKSKQSDCHA